jgi:hypothetical protein
LRKRIRKLLERHPIMRWDAAIAKIIADEAQN